MLARTPEFDPAVEVRSWEQGWETKRRRPARELRVGAGQSGADGAARDGHKRRNSGAWTALVAEVITKAHGAVKSGGEERIRSTFDTPGHEE